MTRRAPSPARSRAGFTLTEVLMAAFIIALGVLGLLALFAGAARQQQGASLTTQSVFLFNSARAIVSPKLGDLEFPDGLPLNDRPVDGIWERIPLDDDTPGGDDPTYALTLKRNANQCEDTNPYFLRNFVKGGTNGLVLYSGPEDPNASLGPGRVDEFAPFDIRRNSAIWGSFARLPIRGVDPETVVVDVILEDAFSGDRRIVRFFRSPGLNYAGYPGENPTNGRFILPVAGAEVDPPSDLQTYIVLDAQTCDANPFQPRADFIEMDLRRTPPTGLAIFSGMRNQEFVAEVLVRSGSARIRDLVGLNDRIRFRTDETAESGRRADMAYSLLTRKSGAQTQVMAISYTLAPTGRDARWIPPERVQDLDDPFEETPPLREVLLDLRYDDNLQQYYFEADADDDDRSWVMVPGQQILVMGRVNSPTDMPYTNPGPGVYPGADAAVRITRVQRRLDGGDTVLRGYLSAAPRARGASYLSVAQRQSGDPRELRCVAVNSSVQALENGGTWLLSPLSADLIR